MEPFDLPVDLFQQIFHLLVFPAAPVTHGAGLGAASSAGHALGLDLSCGRAVGDVVSVRLGGPAAGPGLGVPVDAKAQGRDAVSLAFAGLLERALGLGGAIPHGKVLYDAVRHRAADRIAQAQGLRVAGLQRALGVRGEQCADGLQRRNALFDRLPGIGRCQNDRGITPPHHRIDKLFQSLDASRLAAGAGLTLGGQQGHRRDGGLVAAAFQPAHGLVNGGAVLLLQNDALEVAFQRCPEQLCRCPGCRGAKPQREGHARLGAFQ